MRKSNGNVDFNGNINIHTYTFIYKIEFFPLPIYFVQSGWKWLKWMRLQWIHRANDWNERVSGVHIISEYCACDSTRRRCVHRCWSYFHRAFIFWRTREKLPNFYEYWREPMWNIRILLSKILGRYVVINFFRPVFFLSWSCLLLIYDDVIIMTLKLH